MPSIKINKEELKELLIAFHTLNALEEGGVDNWEWCGESCNNYLKRELCDDFEELAEKDLLEYEEI